MERDTARHDLDVLLKGRRGGGNTAGYSRLVDVHEMGRRKLYSLAHEPEQPRVFGLRV